MSSASRPSFSLNAEEGKKFEPERRGPLGQRGGKGKKGEIFTSRVVRHERKKKGVWVVGAPTSIIAIERKR